MTFMVLPFQLVKKAIKPEKPKEYSSILITGASSGIGAELARGYAKSGVKLVLTARRAEKLAAVKKQCEDKGAEVKTLSLDVNNKDEMNKQIGQLKDRCAELRSDIRRSDAQLAALCAEHDEIEKQQSAQSEHDEIAAIKQQAKAMAAKAIARSAMPASEAPVVASKLAADAAESNKP